MDQCDLRITTWNANGIQNRKQELEIFLNTQNIDVCLISETHLTKQSYLKLRGYKVYHTIHPDNQAKGGSAIIIKDNINHYEEHCLQSAEIQLTVVEIKSIKQKLTVGALYCPPRYNLKKLDYKNFLQHLGDRFIVGGDYNAKHVDWGSRLTTTKGKELREAIREMGCNYHSTGKPTYWPTDPTKIPDLLDFFISRRVSPNFIDIEENLDLDSDHSAVILTLSERIIKKENRPTLVNKTTDWMSFRIDLENKINLKVQLRTKQQLDAEAEKFNSIIQNAAWDNTKEYTHRTVGNNYPKEIRELVKEKRRARRRWQQTRDPSHKNTLNNKTQQLKREIQKLKEESINTFLENLTADEETEYSLWKATRKLKRPNTQIPPIRKVDGTWARDNKQKAETFADHLAEIFKPNDIHSDAFIEEVENLEENEIELVTPKEVTNEIKTNLNPKKAPGFDLISGEILKQLPTKGILMLTYLINAAFRLKYVPSVWKVAEVIMLQKPGKPPHEVKSYRPISLLPIISKLFEKLLLKRLKPLIDRKNLIPNHQFGFRQGHSTIDQVHRMTYVIEKALEEKLVCSAIFLDVAQAFDRVWHDGLIRKLNRVLPKQYVELLSSYLSDRLFRIKQEDEYSELKEVRAGVPQGSVLGPILYLLFTSDFPQLENVTVATFADDTALLAVGSNIDEATNKLQQANDQIYHWTRNWKIKLNEMKSVHVNFTNRNIENPLPVNLNGVIVPYANTAKYLGMTLDAKLRWNEHVKKKRIELGLKYRQLYWLLGRKSRLSIQNKILIYNQVLKPVWMYGAQIWGCAKKSHIKRIQTFQNKVLRNMINAPWYVRNNDLHRDLGIQDVVSEIKRFAGMHESRLQHHNNVEAVQLLDSQNLIRRLKRTKPFELV